MSFINLISKLNSLPQNTKVKWFEKLSEAMRDGKLKQWRTATVAANKWRTFQIIGENMSSGFLTKKESCNGQPLMAQPTPDDPTKPWCPATLAAIPDSPTHPWWPFPPWWPCPQTAQPTPDGSTKLWQPHPCPPNLPLTAWPDSPTPDAPSPDSPIYQAKTIVSWLHTWNLCDSSSFNCTNEQFWDVKPQKELMKLRLVQFWKHQNKVICIQCINVVLPGSLSCLLFPLFSKIPPPDWKTGHSGTSSRQLSPPHRSQWTRCSTWQWLNRAKIESVEMPCWMSEIIKNYIKPSEYRF